MSKQSGRSRCGVRIAGTGLAVPANVMTNEDLAKVVDTSDQWIIKRTGIKKRHVAKKDQTIRDLGAEAIRQAFGNAAIEPTDIDLLLLATMTPEMACPSSAARLVNEIGASPAGAMDLTAACSGFVYALNLAASTIQAGHARTVAAVGVETLSKIIDYSDRRTCILFGDGAGAAILTASDDPEQGCLYQTMNSDGSAWEELYCPLDSSHLPANANGFSGKYNTIQMNGKEVFKFAVTTLESAIDQALTSTGIKPDDLAMVIPHQSNARIIDAARVRLDLPREKMCLNIDRYGNTSAASVPICLHEMIEQQKLKTGDLVLFVAIGGGMTWATNLWRL